MYVCMYMYICIYGGGDLVMSDSCDPTPWTIAQPDSSVHGISQATYWSGLPFPFHILNQSSADGLIGCFHVNSHCK